MKTQRDLIIFDLDGTLIDSSTDIAWCANEVLEYLGYERRGVEEIKKDIGWGVKPLLERLVPNEPEERISDARLKFLEIYDSHLVVDSFLYPGVIQTLEHFKGVGKKLAVVTNKPIGLSEKILKIFELDGFFMSVVGGDSFQRRKPHPEPINAVVQSAQVAPERAVMIGDSPVDCEAGKAAGLYTVGVTYGFRDRSELSLCDVLIDDMTSLMDVIC